MSWALSYQEMELQLQFDKEIIFQTHPLFYFRSMLGRELFKLICPFQKKQCDSCSLRYKCAYSYIFESPVSRDNPILFGRNFASHPFVMECDAVEGNKLKTLRLKIRLIEKAMDYIPIIFWSFIQAGKNGIFKARVPFRVEWATIHGQQAIEGNRLRLPDEHQRWALATYDEQKYGQIFIEMLTPLRFKKEGRYAAEIGFDELIQAALRRMEILVATYSETPFSKIAFPTFEVTYENSQLQWREYRRWSARQRTLLNLGGLVGMMKAEGWFSAKALSLLKGGALFHIGKNTSFGLGKIKVTFVEGEGHD